MTNFVWSIDDAGMGGPAMVESLRRTCRFFEARGIRGTWFVVPKPGGNPLSREWKEALCEARDAGHDIQLHGLTHEDCYEFGPPAWPATAISPELATGFEERKEELMPRYTVENLRSRIEEGMEIFERELNIHPTVFRAPCGAVSKAMYEALQQVGISYHTCAYISATGYEHLPHRSGHIRQEWTDEIPHRPFRWYSDVIELPLINEYTWRGASQHEAEFMALAKQDIERINQESPVVVILMHTHGIADNYDYAFRLVDAVLDQVKHEDDSTFTTLGELVKSDEVSQAATQIGPDVLPV